MADEKITDRIYINLSTINKDVIGKLCVLNESYTTPPIKEIHDWQASIIRFKVPGLSIPIFRAIPQPGPPPYGPNTDPNLTVYSITLEYIDTGVGATTHNFQQFLELIPGSTIPVPSRWDKIDTTNSNYYSIFHYQGLIFMLNNALLIAYNNLYAYAGYVTPPPAEQSQPFFYYDPDTQLISFHVQSNWNNPRLGVWFSSTLNKFLSSFDVFWNISQPDPNGKDVKINIIDFFNNREVFPPGSIVPPMYNFLNMSEEFPSLYAWSDLAQIVLLSNDFGGRFEVNPSFNDSPSSQYDTTPIIADIEPSVAEPGDNRNYIQYEPTAEYKRIKITKYGSIYSLSISVRWRDGNGVLYPLYIPPDGLATIKILMEKIR